MTVYLIGKITIADRETYANYEAGFMDIFSQSSGKLLAVEEAPTIVEGNWSCTRTVLTEFPSKDDALAWYESPAYQTLMQHRLASSEGDIVIINALPSMPS